MRDLAELNINERGKSIGRPGPSKDLVRKFEANFAIKLPEDDLVLLRHSNGGGWSSIPSSLSIVGMSVFGRSTGCTTIAF
jgi:hypothetical protein